MKVGQGEFVFEWIENWASIPATESGRINGRTHGAVALENDDVLIFNQAQPAVLRFGADGKLKSAWGDRFGAAHGMTLALEADVPVLWLTDENSPEVVKTTLDGRRLMNLERPDIPVYRGGGR